MVHPCIYCGRDYSPGHRCPKNPYWSEMYQRGYDNAAISFAYIPDFKNQKEKADFERGLKDGYSKIKELKA